MYKYLFLSKLEVVKLFRCNKYRSTLFHKLQLRIYIYMGGERERERYFLKVLGIKSKLGGKKVVANFKE